jgi:hypothetical protein
VTVVHERRAAPAWDVRYGSDDPKNDDQPQPPATEILTLKLKVPVGIPILLPGEQYSAGSDTYGDIRPENSTWVKALSLIKSRIVRGPVRRVGGPYVCICKERCHIRHTLLSGMIAGPASPR